MSRATLIMLVGVPCSGKSTWLSHVLKSHNPDTYVVISSDNLIEQKAKELNTTYDAIWSEYAGWAQDECYKQLRQATIEFKDIFWDQTNLTKKTRDKKLKQVPSYYNILFIVFPTPERDELDRRLASRPGKSIPSGVIDNMIEQFEMPTLQEGFYLVYGGSQ